MDMQTQTSALLESEPGVFRAKVRRRPAANEYFPRPDFARLGTFLPLIDRYGDWLAEERRLSGSAVTKARSGMHTFLRYLQDERRLDVTPRDVDQNMAIEFQTWNIDRGLSAKFVLELQGVFRSFYAWLHSERVLPDNTLKDIALQRDSKATPRHHHANEFFYRPDFARLGSFLPLIDRFCHSLKHERSASPWGVAGARSRLKAFLRYLQDVRVLDITPGNVDRRTVLEFQAWNIERGMSNRTVCELQGRLRQFFRWLDSERILPGNLIKDIPVPRSEQAMPRPLPLKDVVKILSQPNINDWLERRDLAILELMYGSGLRIGDTLRLRIKDVRLEDQVLGPHVRFWTKWKREALVPLSMASLGILRLHLRLRGHRSPEERLFVGIGRSRLSVNSFSHRWKYYLARANLNMRLSVHQLRHSTASHLFANGMTLEQVREVLVHRDIGTSEIYTQVSPEKLFAVHAKADIRGAVEKHR